MPSTTTDTAASPSAVSFTFSPIPSSTPKIARSRAPAPNRTARAHRQAVAAKTTPSSASLLMTPLT